MNGFDCRNVLACTHGFAKETLRRRKVSFFDVCCVLAKIFAVAPDSYSKYFCALAAHVICMVASFSFDV
jgi:hypothetical protein